MRQLNILAKEQGRKALLFLILVLVMLPTLACDCEPENPARNPCQLAIGAVKAGVEFVVFTVK